MNRRGFLQFIVQASAAVVVAHKIPLDWTPKPVRNTAAMEAMREVYNRCSDSVWGGPTHLVVSADVYRAFQSELMANERFCKPEDGVGWKLAPLFKGVPVFQDPTMKPWTIYGHQGDVKGAYMVWGQYL